MKMAHASKVISETAEAIGLKLGGHEEGTQTKLPSKDEHSGITRS